MKKDKDLIKDDIMEILKERFGKENCKEVDGCLFVFGNKEEKEEDNRLCDEINDIEKHSLELFNEWYDFINKSMASKVANKEELQSFMYDMNNHFPKHMKMLRGINYNVDEILNNMNNKEDNMFKQVEKLVREEMKPIKSISIEDIPEMVDKLLKKIKEKGYDVHKKNINKNEKVSRCFHYNILLGYTKDDNELGVKYLTIKTSRLIGNTKDIDEIERDLSKTYKNAKIISYNFKY